MSKGYHAISLNKKATLEMSGPWLVIFAAHDAFAESPRAIEAIVPRSAVLHEEGPFAPVANKLFLRVGVGDTVAGWALAVVPPVFLFGHFGLLGNRICLCRG